MFTFIIVNCTAKVKRGQVRKMGTQLTFGRIFYIILTIIVLFYRVNESLFLDNKHDGIIY